MADIRKRTGKKGPTYQVRYASNTAKGGYDYATFTTLKEARAFLESGETKKHKAPRSNEIKTVDSAITKWLDICEKEGRDDRGPVSPSTLENYEWRSRTMKAYDWPCGLQELQEADVIAFRSWLKKNCPSDQAQKVLSSFHSVLIEMKKRDIIDHDPCENVFLRANPRDKEPVQIPTLDEFRAILAAADRLANSKNNEIASAWERYRPMIYLAADSGMRPQEYLVLPPVALLKNGVEVIQALDRSNRIGPPKTKAGRRYIPISSHSLDMAKHYAARHGAGDLVFPVRRGSTYQRYNVFVRRGFHKLMEEAGLVTEEVRDKRKILVKHYTPYSLRHFFASMLIEKNTNLKYVQTVMGHESIKMTFDVYGHIIRRKDTDALDQTGGILQYVA